MEMDDWTKILIGNRLIIFDKPEELVKGLLGYEKPPYGHAFLFKMPGPEDILHVTTVGLKFTSTGNDFLVSSK